jgi:signal transduction histidine kinase
MTSRKPRLMLGLAATLVVAALGLFAFLLLDNRAAQRENLEARFQAGAKVTAALVESVFGSSVQQAAQQNARDFGGPTVSLERLNRRTEKSHLAYGVVLGPDGSLLAATSSAGPDVLQRLLKRPEHIAQVLEGGKPYRLTGFVGPSTLEYASSFQSESGERRVIVQGFPTTLLSVFLSGVLDKIPSLAPQRAYVVDGKNRVIASNGSATLGEVAPVIDDPDRTNAEASVAGSEWRILLSRKHADVYRGFNSSTQWVLLAVLGLAGVGLLMLLARIFRREVDLQKAYVDLERSNEELLRSNGELEQFASVASHDLQEPLRKVQAFGDQLERRYKDDLPEEAQDYLQRMCGAASRMSTLIEDLLRFSRITTHARASESIDLSTLAADVVADLDALITDTGGKVVIGRLPAVQADPVQMRQLLQNLIANALKFHRPDVTPLVRLRACSSSNPDLVAFSVVDNGIGFEPQYTERIFRVFERLHARDVYAGTGIGLAVCRKIVERAGGNITAKGYPGEGAEFIIELPPAVNAGRLEEDPAPEPAYA